MSGAMSMFGGSPRKGSTKSSSSFKNPLSRPGSVASDGYIGIATPNTAAQQEYQADAEYAAANTALVRQGSEKLGDVFALKSGLRDANVRGRCDAAAMLLPFPPQARNETGLSKLSEYSKDAVLGFRIFVGGLAF